MLNLFTSESVASGHPDKICDQISDAVVDAAITRDPNARVAVETLVTANHIIMAGEVTCKNKIPYETLARQTVRELAYIGNKYQFSDKSPVTIYIHEQSPDIAGGVDTGGAGDQGMMYGYAVRETPQLMPLPIMLAHGLVRNLDQARTGGLIPKLRPDGKSQVTVEYDGLKPVRLARIVMAVPHEPDLTHAELRENLITKIIKPQVAFYGLRMPRKTDIIINGVKGRWTKNGPAADTGVTGRKIIVDTYGSSGRHGGGAFSGKDPTKVDRSAAYAARFIAKNVVAAKLADRCEVRLAYVIGHQDPVARGIETFGTSHNSPKQIESFAWKLLDLSVGGIIRGLDLRQPIYRSTACYGHFGRAEFPWERIG